MTADRSLHVFCLASCFYLCVKTCILCENTAQIFDLLNLVHIDIVYLYIQWLRCFANFHRFLYINFDVELSASCYLQIDMMLQLLYILVKNVLVVCNKQFDERLACFLYLCLFSVDQILVSELLLFCEQIVLKILCYDKRPDFYKINCQVDNL